MDMAGHPRTIVNYTNCKLKETKMGVIMDMAIEGNKNGRMLFYFCYFMD